jgi:hypothetical protein
VGGKETDGMNCVCVVIMHAGAEYSGRVLSRPRDRLAVTMPLSARANCLIRVVGFVNFFDELMRKI